MVHEALGAADVLAQENIDIEVIELLSISHWDKETVFNSVGKIHPLLFAHETVKSFGIGVEVSAAWERLICPILKTLHPLSKRHWSGLFSWEEKDHASGRLVSKGRYSH
jgi:pyruvate/2-oxoglutarate/acetoin dehydrogenase E1 component